MDQGSGSDLQEINEELYKRNLELALVNKTLSLLRKLYQISLQSLDLTTLSAQVSESIRESLNMEVVGVLHFDEQKDILKPLHYSQSERFANALAPDSDINTEISNASGQPTLKQLLIDKAPVITGEIADIWNSLVGGTTPRLSLKDSHVETFLIYPMVTHDKVIGILLLGINRSYELLSKFEKDSITSLIDVTAVAVDKALVYDQLSHLNVQLQALDKARAEFITLASHQLRTPPATLKWYLGSLANGDYGKLEPEAQQIVEKAQVTNNGLISLIDDLLNVSRIERGKMEFLFEPSDLTTITKLAVDQLVPQALVKGVELIYHPPLSPLPLIMADQEKLRQVINNMIDNSIKYTPKGTVTVTLFEKDENVCVSVADTGKGISEDQLRTLFGKYNRGKDSAMQSTGLGLGMYLAKVVIEQHKGKIWAESDGVGHGATFTFSIPINSGVAETTILDLTKE
jgi:signal transduction histidine kinase